MIQGLEGGNPIERLSLDEMALHEGTCVCARVWTRATRAPGGACMGDAYGYEVSTPTTIVLSRW